MFDGPDQSCTARKPNNSKILIVDCDPHMRDSVSFLVSNMGFEPQQAGDGLEAVQRYQAEQKTISLVIMDVDMPRLGGVEATRKIREFDPSAKVILCGGSARGDIWKAKPNAFILKSFIFLNLQQTVRSLLGDG